LPKPDFIIVGERRCGTTSLAHLLEAHPDIVLHEKRELGYFIEAEARHGSKRAPIVPLEADADHWDRTHSPEAYANLFGGLAGAAVGEKSADYLFWRPAHARIARFLPDARFIVTLRDPVSRAWSHYCNELGKGRESMPFEDALAAEEERCRTSAYALNHLSYARRGFYDESLLSFLSHVPRRRVHIVTLDEMKRDPDQALAQIFSFLGLDPARWRKPESLSRNENWAMVQKPWVRGTALRAVDRGYDAAIRVVARGLVRDKLARRAMLQSLRTVFREPARGHAMASETSERLRDLYAPHVEALEALLSRSFAEWRVR
jgi:hypothetical protein